MAKEEQADVNGELPLPWAKIQSAVWLIGLAILFWQGWLFPGILVLVAISGLLQAGLHLYLKRREETATLEATRELHLPDTCPQCGGPISPFTVQWNGPSTATCPYCHSNIKVLDVA